MRKNRNKQPRTVFSQRTFGNDFVRGALVSGIVAAFAREGPARFDRATARAALQGGAALAAASMAADALQQNRYPGAVLAAAGAAASVYVLQRLLSEQGTARPAFEHRKS
ncbi:MAG: hypothetical protein LBO79_06100 [Zoogloeaceae bacterium]|jgi:hypothetical protein|nr:hypothetical protein [Zoogloeaceae bacterium]